MKDCFTCGSKKDLKTFSLKVLITALPDLEISSQNTSELFCQQCLELLKEFQQLQVRTQEVQSHLRELLNKKCEPENIHQLEEVEGSDNEGLETIDQDEDEYLAEIEVETTESVNTICIHCKESFTDTKTYAKHLDRVHNAFEVTSDDIEAPDDSTKCNICNREFETVQKKKKHFGIHKTKIKRQKISNFFQKKRRNFIDTKEREEYGIRESFNCPQCDASYKHRFLLLKHAKSTHPTEFLNIQAGFESLFDRTCGKCHIILDTYEQKLKHVHHHKEAKDSGSLRTKCPICDKELLRKSIPYHLETHSAKMCKCDFCDKSFPSEALKQSHMKTNHENLVCGICCKRFKHRATYRTHCKQHVDPFPFPCKFDCGKKFKDMSSRAIHVRRIHTKEKPFECKLCDKAFYNSSGLAAHVQRHGEK